MAVYRVWHTAENRAINISGLPRVFPEGSLEAAASGNKITVRSSTDGVVVLYQLDFSRFGQQNGNTFSDVATTLAYLNSVFDENHDNDVRDPTIRLGQTAEAFRAISADGLYVNPTQESLSTYAGVISQEGAAGDLVPYRKDGLMFNSAWLWNPGRAIYVSSNGTLTQTLPSPCGRRIGYAMTATTVNLDPAAPLEWNAAEW